MRLLDKKGGEDGKEVNAAVAAAAAAWLGCNGDESIRKYMAWGRRYGRGGCAGGEAKPAAVPSAPRTPTFKCSVKLSPRCKPGRTERAGGAAVADDNTAAVVLAATVAATEAVFAAQAELCPDVGTVRLPMGGGGGGVAALDDSVRDATTRAGPPCSFGTAAGAIVRRDTEPELDDSALGGGLFVVANLFRVRRERERERERQRERQRDRETASERNGGIYILLFLNKHKTKTRENTNQRRIQNAVLLYQSRRLAQNPFAGEVGNTARSAGEGENRADNGELIPPLVSTAGATAARLGLASVETGALLRGRRFGTPSDSI
jgi:hypothetical protein